MKNNGFWCMSRSPKYQIRTAITSTTLMEGSTVQRCIFISYVSNVQPEGGCAEAVCSIFIVWPIHPLKLVSHVVQKRHDETQETHRKHKNRVRASLHRGGGTPNEITRLGGVTHLSTQSLILI